MFARVTLIIVLGFIAYACMLRAPFKTMDDRVSIVNNPTIKSIANIPELFKQGYFNDQHYYRPLVNLSYMGEYQAFGLNSFFYNFDNLILHILNALLVFFLVSNLTNEAYFRHSTSNNDKVGFWTAILFVIHPVQWEAVCNISGRAILMSTFFILSAFILFLKFYKSNNRGYLLASVVAFFGGLLCKESAGVLPFVLLAFLCFEKSKTGRRKLMTMIPFLMVIVGYLWLRYYLGMTKSFYANDTGTLILSFVTFLRSVITDLRLFILPVDLHFDRCLPIFTSFILPSAILSVVFWMMVLIALYCWRRGVLPFPWFLILWFSFELLPVSQLFAGIGVGSGWVSTAEHFLYLAVIPVFVGMVMAFQWAYERNAQNDFLKPVVLKFLAGGFLVFLLITAIEQSIYASNEYSMINRSLAFEPNNPRLQGAMAMLSVYRNDIPDAEKHFRLAIKAEPTNPTYHISLGTALCQEGKWIEGLAQFVVLDPGKDKALADSQEKLTMMHIREQLRQGKTFDARGWLAMGIYYAKTGQNSLAIDAFSKSVSLNPVQTDAWFNLGSLYEADKNWTAARVAYNKLLELHDLTVFQRSFAVKHLMTIEGR